MFKKLLLLSFMVISLLGCPFDEDDNDPTVDAYLSIQVAIEKDDFKEAKVVAIKWKELYQYFEDTYKEPINTKLLSSIGEKDKKQIIFWLNRSMVVEIKELINLAQKSIDKYQKARIYLVKAKKHLDITNKLISKKDLKIGKKSLRKLLKSLGNPGMMGIGKKPKDLTKYLKHKKVIFDILDNNF